MQQQVAGGSETAEPEHDDGGPWEPGGRAPDGRAEQEERPEGGREPLGAGMARVLFSAFHGP